MKIAIYDSNTDDTKLFNQLLKDYFGTVSIHYPDQFPDWSSYYDLIFLDIASYSKVKTSSFVYQQYINKTILVITSTQEYLAKGYNYGAKRFWKKPIHPDSFYNNMKELLQSLLPRYAYFFDPSLSNHKIYYKDIAYIEYENHHSILHMRDGCIFISHSPLKEWKQKCSHYGFSQPYKSFLVNLEVICAVTLDQRDLILEQGERIPLSRYYRPKVFQDYKNYIGYKVAL